MSREHRYTATVEWTGNLGPGTAGYKSYSRDHAIRAAGKPDIPGSSDPAFRGDPARWNPEDMLVAALASCHMLWYLHLCSAARIVVQSYADTAEGTMVEDASGGGRFAEVTLRPRILLAPGADAARARALHAEAHEKCFIANSVNFSVRHAAEIAVAEG